jgi:hypothetical protein
MCGLKAALTLPKAALLWCFTNLWCFTKWRLVTRMLSLGLLHGWLAPELVPNFVIDVRVPDIAAEDIEEALADLAGYSLVRRNP